MSTTAAPNFCLTGWDGSFTEIFVIMLTQDFQSKSVLKESDMALKLIRSWV
jgi:hypothetical protein